MKIGELDGGTNMNVTSRQICPRISPVRVSVMRE